MLFGPETPIPVYFAPWSPDLQIILDDVVGGFITDEKSETAAELMFNSISASGYQVVVATSQAIAKTDVKVATLQGKLTGTGAEEKLPTIALVAHYDSTGVAPVRSELMDKKSFRISIHKKGNEEKYISVFVCLGTVFRSRKQCLRSGDATRISEDIFRTLFRWTFTSTI